jgi:hypothetical protein
MSNEVMIHVRFAPNGTVMEIAERPDGCSAQDWFNLLSRRDGLAYQALSGGRGLFRLSPEALAELRAQTLAEVAA